MDVYSSGLSSSHLRFKLLNNFCPVPNLCFRWGCQRVISLGLGTGGPETQRGQRNLLHMLGFGARGSRAFSFVTELDKCGLGDAGRHLVYHGGTTACVGKDEDHGEGREELSGTGLGREGGKD